ncbi:MAG: ABC transporter ATP-binding protein [Acidobacteriota bacterium]
MLEIRDLGKRYSGNRILEAISVKVGIGESLVVWGPSGSGKTTLLRLIAGLEAPTAGEIRLDGKLASTPDWLLPPSSRRLGFVFQTSALWPHLTVAGNVRFGLQLWPRREAQQRVGDLLEQMGISHLARRFPHQISGGEARRVALARALAPLPRFLLLDEPLTHLNEELKHLALDVIRRHREETDVCVIYVTHDREEAEAMSGVRLNLDRIHSVERFQTQGAGSSTDDLGSSNS